MNKAILMAAVSAATLLSLSNAVIAHDGLQLGDAQATSTADDHAPIGVMGDHMHKKGEWMLGYRYMHMEMDGLRDGTSNVSTTEAASYANALRGWLASQLLCASSRPRWRWTCMCLVRCTLPLIGSRW